MWQRVIVICEGETEEEFIHSVLYPSFVQLNINLTAITIKTGKEAGDVRKGGSLNYDRVERAIIHSLREGDNPTVTTLFDLYKLPSNFPCFDEAWKQTDLKKRLDILTKALHDKIIAKADCESSRFIPYLQPYEFEALLFSDVEILVNQQPEWKKLGPVLQAARDRAESPEHINDGRDTKPAACLKNSLTRPKFKKTNHGPVIAGKIGLEKIEAECAFFSAWLDQIRNLAKS
jgi:hypothetical protein